jgi:hypothetical protein
VPKGKFFKGIGRAASASRMDCLLARYHSYGRTFSGTFETRGRGI